MTLPSTAPTPETAGGPPEILDGKYRLEERLGEGSAGIVYRATHLALKKAFALKALKPGPAPDPFSVARFQREAEALGRLRHPNIVEVTDFGVDSAAGAPYLVMELLEGISLAQLCRTEGPLPLDRALAILDAMAAAIDAAHEQGILHRDLKPGNVLLCGTGGEAQTVKVLDFGLAEIFAPPSLVLDEEGDEPASGAEEMAESLTSTGDLLGTPLYVAPEVILRARAGPASDIYSFGVIAYEMLAGRPPFQGRTLEVLASHLEKEPPAGTLSAEMWSALRECLAKDPALRPATAREAVRQLRAAAGREERLRWRRTEAPRRLLLSALLAAAVPVAASLLPAGLPAVERWAHDLRLRSAPARSPDPRILLVTFDEASLSEGSTSLANRADEIGATLERIFAAGARGLAVDFLLPDAWSQSQGFTDLVLRHPEALTLAAYSAPDGRVLGTGCLRGLTAAALGPQRSDALFGFVNLDEDSDGRIRRGRLLFRDQEGGWRPSWAARAAAMLSPLPGSPDLQDFWIDHRLEPSGFDRISWRGVPAALKTRPWIFRGRLILVGGDIMPAGDDVYRIPRHPGRPERVSGLVLQALMADTIVSGLPVREAPRIPFLVGAALWAGLVAAAFLLIRRWIPVITVLVLSLMLYLGLAVLIFQKAGLLLPVALLTPPLFLSLALALIFRFALTPIPSWSQES